MTVPDPGRLIPAGSRVLCALSAGPDSVMLTHLLASNAARLGITVAAAHFTHGLRPQDAEAEAALAQALCRGLEIPFFRGSGDTAAYAAAHGLGIEEAARALRYAFLRETAQGWGADLIATGHHRDDQAETVLFRLARGTGTDGLRGIPAREGDLVRPLLELSRADILAYLREHGLDYASDPSNDSLDHARNRLRHRVLPQLEQVHPGAAGNLAAAAKLAEADRDFIAPHAAALADRATPTDRGWRIPLAWLTGAHPALRGRAVRILCGRLGLAPSLRHVEAVLALADRGPSARVTLPDGITARREYGDLLLERAAEPASPPAETVLQPGENRWGDWIITVSKPGLTVRTRRTGDTVFRGGHHRSIKKLLIDLRVPRDMRDTLPVVCCGDRPLAFGRSLPVTVTAGGFEIELRIGRTGSAPFPKGGTNP